MPLGQLSHPTAAGAGRMTITTAAGQGENTEQGVEVTLISGACLTVCLSDGSSSDGTGLGGTVLSGDGVAGHSGRFVWYELIIGGGEGARGTRCATTEGGRTVPVMRGRCGRVTRRSGRRSPSALPHQGWGTTVTATRSGCRGSGSGLRFALVGLRGMNQL